MQITLAKFFPVNDAFIDIPYIIKSKLYNFFLLMKCTSFSDIAYNTVGNLCDRVLCCVYLLDTGIVLYWLWNKTRLCSEFFIFTSVFPAIEREHRVNIDTLLESFRHVVEPTTRMQQEKKIIEFTDIALGWRKIRKRMAHNRIDGALFLDLLHLL